MFNVQHFLTRTQKILLEYRFKNYLNESIHKYNKLTIEMNNNNKKKQDIENILNETRLTRPRTTNHIPNHLTYHNFIFIASVVSMGALLFYKSI
jgi:hypothetical protein